MTAAWQTPISKDPPLVGVSIAPKRYTHELIEASGDFVLNVPTAAILEQTHGCGKISGREEDKFEKFELSAVPARKVASPLIGECIAHLECRLYERLTIGDHTLFVGEIVAASVEEELFDEFLQVEKEGAKTLQHLGSNVYTFPDVRVEADTK
jgi:flavin reductase (DIM6/NTAB) family NADH-FMN oxidoreductase RutF